MEEVYSDFRGVASFLRDRELRYLLSPVSVALKQALPKIELGSVSLKECAQGDLIELPRWVGEILAELGFAEFEDEGFEVEIFKTLSRERIQGALQLSTVKSEFYLQMKRYLAALKAKGERDAAARLRYEKIAASAYDLLTMRAGKILYNACASGAPPDLSGRITREEGMLFEFVRKEVERWRKAVLDGE